MDKIIHLKLGPESPRPTPHEEETRVAQLQATVEHHLPEFSKSVEKAAAQAESCMVLHQDAFAAGYDRDEYTLLGLAIKYAGLMGVELRIIGKNHETF